MYKNFSDIILLIGHVTRLTMLIELASGKAIPAGELAKLAKVSPQTASEHLTKLTNAELISVEKWGKHRYYKIHDEKVINAIKALSILAPPIQSNSLKETTKKESLYYARTCYGHIAGNIGVEITDALVENSYIYDNDEFYILTNNGKKWLENLGLKTTKSKFSKPIPKHIDWTERRYHIAGPIALEIANLFFDYGWIKNSKINRCIKVTDSGKRAFKNYLNINI